MSGSIFNPRPLVILGSGGHARTVSEAATSAGFSVLGFLDSSPSESSVNLQLFSSFDELDFSSVDFALGIGTNFAREEGYARAKEHNPEARFPPIVHLHSWVSPTATIREGAVILAQAVVGANSLVDVGALLNTGASLDHDSSVGAFASLGPGARTGGNVAVGDRTLIGLQAGILQGVKIGDDAVLGAHALALEPIPSKTIAYGSPARIVRSRETRDRHY